MLSYRLSVLYSAGRIEGSLCFGTLRTLIYPCRHHRTEPRHQSLSFPYPFDGFEYPQDFAGGFEQIQAPADIHFAKLLRSRYCHLLLARSCISLKPLHTNMALTTIIDTFGDSSANPMEKNNQHPILTLICLSWGTKTSAPGSDVSTSNGSVGGSSRFEKPMLSAVALLPSSSEAFHPSRQLWGNRSPSFHLLSSSENH